MTTSASTLAAVRRILCAGRDKLQVEWTAWIVGRLATVDHLRPETVARQVNLLLDLLVHMTGPLRRESAELWLGASELYGRTGAQRGLAAGEIVEEFQYLRELLIRHLSELIAALPARQSMAAVLRINRFLAPGPGKWLLRPPAASPSSRASRSG